MTYIAGATYFLYLWHPVVVWALRHHLARILELGPIATASLVYLGSILAGVIAIEIWRRVLNISLSSRIAGRRTGSSA